MEADELGGGGGGERRREGDSVNILRWSRECLIAAACPLCAPPCLCLLAQLLNIDGKSSFIFALVSIPSRKKKSTLKTNSACLSTCKYMKSRFVRASHHVRFFVIPCCVGKHLCHGQFEDDDEEAEDDPSKGCDMTTWEQFTHSTTFPPLPRLLQM